MFQSFSHNLSVQGLSAKDKVIYNFGGCWVTKLLVTELIIERGDLGLSVIAADADAGAAR